MSGDSDCVSNRQLRHIVPAFCLDAEFVMSLTYSCIALRFAPRQFRLLFLELSHGRLFSLQAGTPLLLYSTDLDLYPFAAKTKRARKEQPCLALRA